MPLGTCYRARYLNTELLASGSATADSRRLAARMDWEGGCGEQADSQDGGCNSSCLLHVSLFMGKRNLLHEKPGSCAKRCGDGEVESR